MLFTIRSWVIVPDSNKCGCTASAAESSAWDPFLGGGAGNAIGGKRSLLIGTETDINIIETVGFGFIRIQ